MADSHSIERLDPNMKTANIDGVDLQFLPANADRFRLSGFPHFSNENVFCRLPQAALDQTSEGVRELAWHCSGGVLRFRSNSAALAIRVRLRGNQCMSHMPNSGMSGFDLIQGAGPSGTFKANVRPEPGEAAYEKLFCRDLPMKIHTWTIYFPLYNGVEELEVGLSPKSEVSAAPAYAVDRPVLFYGSSITQGGCASRPGNAYPAIIGRRLNVEIINYGFSGNARGEQVMAELIGSLNLSAFVMDYDHNSPSPEFLAGTHEPFFQTIRKLRPKLPVVFVSKPDFWGREQDIQRRDIVRRTYETAVQAGDKNVFFVDGATLFGETERDLCTVDGCHPNDIGFLRMADGMTPAIRKALKLQP